MEEKTCTEQRRSQRVVLSVGVIVQGTCLSGAQIREEARTLVVNAHGAFLPLQSPVAVGQVLSVRHNKTNEERFCKVARIVKYEVGETAVGIEFLYPSPRFWRIALPPRDWEQASWSSPWRNAGIARC
jgi:hypothetical protein